MFEARSGIDELDRDGVLGRLTAARLRVVEAEAEELALAAHWADLHNPEAVIDPAGAFAGTGAVLPGTERPRRLGGDGTPEVLEFAAAEFGAAAGCSTGAGENRIGDALDIRHRHPASWASIHAGRVRVWMARKVARMTGTAALSRDQAVWVDAQVVGYYTCLPWVRFEALVAAKIIEVDPAAAQARAEAAAAARFVHAGQTNQYGLKTIIAKAHAGDVIWFLATVNRIAQILADHGQPGTIDERRATAIGILANPAKALQLLQDAELTTSDPGDADPDPDPDPVPDTRRCPTCAGNGVIRGESSVFTKTPVVVDPSRLLPPATLYLHLSQDGFTRDETGVARFEGVGPITTTQAKQVLGHCQVTIKPVIDLADQAPVDGYETPARLREALHLRNPACILPWSTNLSRKKDTDHTIPYLDPDSGGPPGQTGMSNLGPLGRFGHRLKTHGRWRLKQPEPGTYLWRSPERRYYLVDHTGTHTLPKTLGDAAWTMLNTGIGIHPADNDDPIIDYQPERRPA